MISTDRLCMGCMNDNGGEQICPICGFDSQEKNPKNAVPIKTMINDRFVVGRMLSSNGEGIEYIGWDTANDAIVKIKEYFPDGVAKRNPDKTVTMVKGCEYTYNEGLLEFLEINKAIENSDLPALVPVVDVFEENGTAFAVMQSIQGDTLSDFLSRNGGTLKWEQARALFLPVIDTINGMHALGIVHGGISTDTIIVGRDGKLRVTGYSIKKFRYENEEIKYEMLDGFAAIEQYANQEQQFSVGPHTDVYAFCATLFNVLIGNLPAKATARLQNDSMSIPSKFAEELPRQVLSSLANALQVKPQDRTADMEAFKNQLVYGEMPGTVADSKNAGGNTKKKKSRAGNGVVMLITVIITILLILIGAVVVGYIYRDELFGNNGNSTDTDIPSNSSTDVDDTSSVESYPDDLELMYIVPDFEGEYYSKLYRDANGEYTAFKFKVKDKIYSAQPRGTIISQSVVKGSEVEKDTEIEFVISMGPKEFKMPSLINMSRDQAILTLLKAGFLYENIDDTLEIYDEDYAPGVVIDQFPLAGETVTSDIGVDLYFNSYLGDEEY